MDSTDGNTMHIHSLRPALLAGMAAVLTVSTIGCSPSPSARQTPATSSTSATPSSTSSADVSGYVAYFPDSLAGFTRDGSPAVDTTGAMSASYTWSAEGTEINVNVTLDPAAKFGVKDASDVESVSERLFSILMGDEWIQLSRDVWCATDFTAASSQSAETAASDSDATQVATLDGDCLGMDTTYMMTAYGKVLVGESAGSAINDFAVEFWNQLPARDQLSSDEEATPAPSSSS